MPENFDEMAERFDTDARIERAKIVAREIRAHVADGASKSAIEFGCGTGLVGFELIGDFDSIVFLDSSEGMVQRVAQKLSGKGGMKSSAICMDIMDEPTGGLSGDCIFSSLVLHHIIDTEAALKRLYGMLNDGGHLLIVDIDTDDGSFHAKYPDFDGHNGFDHQTLWCCALNAGFRQVSVHTFYHGNKNVNGIDKPYSLFIMDAAK